MRRPKTVAAVLVVGTALIGTGSAVAATLPSWPSHHAVAGGPSPAVSVTSPRQPATGGPATGGPAASTRRRAAKSLTPVSRTRVPSRHPKSHGTASVTYVVKPGDTLSGIAEWFRLHGYGGLYAANASVIGKNPNLIVPGERITIADGVMTMSHPR